MLSCYCVFCSWTSSVKWHSFEFSVWWFYQFVLFLGVISYIFRVMYYIHMQAHPKMYTVACSLSLSLTYTSSCPHTHTAILSPANLLSPIYPSTHHLDYPLTQWSFTLLHTSSLISEEHMRMKLLFSSVLLVNILLTHRPFDFSGTHVSYTV